MSIHVKTAAGWEELGVSGGGAPGAAVIGDATADDPDNYPVNKSSLTGDGTNGDLGQAYDVYEFTGSGELVVSEPGLVEALVVGGGGGGGTYGGGGGAGGFLQITNAYLEQGSLTVTIGAGGAGGIWSTGLGPMGANGETSRIGSYYCPGGGAGAGAYAGNVNRNTGARGASGGGGANGGGGQWPGGSGTPTLGSDGGSSHNAGPSYAGGGGGGASAVGATGGASAGGAGGNGSANTFTGSSVTYCGGGGGGGENTTGGAGGTGGGGAGSGSGSSNGTAGSANTGGGGGAGGSTAHGAKSNGGAGGSGIVIVRVKVPAESYPFRTKTTAPRTAHAARIEDGIVRQVIVIPHLDDDDAKITEYCNRIGLPGEWVDTSYLGARRGKYAGVGDEFRHEGRSGEGEFVSPGVEEPEPEPDLPEGAVTYSVITSGQPKAGQAACWSAYMTAHTTDQNGDELSCEFQQIVKVTIPSIDEDKEYLITKWLENNGYKQIYGPKVSNRGDLNDGDTMHLSIRNNVPWTDQVIPVYSQSSSTCSSPGYVYKTGSDMHYNGLDKDGNPWPLVMPGMRLQATKDGVAGDVCRVLEVHQNNGYIKIQCDKQLLGSGLGQYTITVVQ